MQPSIFDPDDRASGPAEALSAADDRSRQAVLDAIDQLARTRSTPWSADDVHALLDLEGIDLARQPLSGGPNMLGGAFQAKRRAGVIRPTGEVSVSRRPSRHGSLQRLWLGTDDVRQASAKQAPSNGFAEGDRA